MAIKPCCRVVWALGISAFALCATPVSAAPFLAIETDVFLYATSTYDVLNRETGVGGTLHHETGGLKDYYTAPVTGKTFVRYSSSGTVSFGVMKASIEATIGGNDFTGVALSVQTTAYFQDTLVFYTDEATSGVAHFEYEIDGVGAVENDSFAVLQGQTWGGFLSGRVGDVQGITFIDTTNRTNGGTVMSAAIPFQNGLPVLVEANLGAVMSIFCLFDCWPRWEGHGYSNFGNTAVLKGIQLFDNGGKPIETFNIVSESGTRYTAAGVVPEPSTMSLFLGALGVATARRIRQARRPQHHRARLDQPE